MESIVLDAATAELLRSLGDYAEIRDADGRVIGIFGPPPTISDEERAELERRRKDRSGRRPMREVLDELRATFPE